MRAHRHIGRSSRRNDEGVALLLALLFIVLLSVMVTEFSYEARVEASSIAGTASALDAYVVARSAVAMGMSLLATDLEEASQTPPTGHAAESGSYDSLLDVWAAQDELQNPSFQVFDDDTVMMWTVTDEYGKINLNALFQQNDEGARVENPALVETLRKFFQARNVEEDPTDAILDWLDGPDTNDTTDETRATGAESDYYQALKTPYVARNGPMVSIEELLLIKGITPAVYFGDPTQIDPQTGERLQPPLYECLTVHGHSKGAVNANTVPREVLVAMEEACGGGTAKTDAIITQRLTQPFTKEALGSNMISWQAQADKGGQPKGTDLLVVSSKMFRVWGDGFVGHTQVRIEAMVWRAAQRDTDKTKETDTGDAFRIVDWRIIR